MSVARYKLGSPGNNRGKATYMLHPAWLTDRVWAPGMRCQKCAFASPESAAFCSRCGAALDSSRSVPERDGQPSSQAERRRLTIVFCDLVGSTALSGPV